MKTTQSKIDGSRATQLPPRATPSGGRLIHGSAGLGIWRARHDPVRSGSWVKPAFQCTLVLLLWSSLALQAATTVTQIAVRADSSSGYSLFIKSDGSLWAVGSNEYGHLGDGTFNNTNKPVEIVSNGVVTVAAGYNYSLFTKSDGSLWGMGDNYSGELGSGSFNSTNTPVEIVPNGVVAAEAVMITACSSNLTAASGAWVTTGLAACSATPQTLM